MRLFIGVQLPPDVVRELARVREELAAKAQGHFCRDEQFHITLKFLGETPRGDVPAVLRAMASVVKRPAIDLHLTLIGCFGRAPGQALCWAGVGGDLSGLHSFQRDLDQSMQALGYPSDHRGFTPHITLGRAVDLDHETFAEIKPIHFRLDRCTLFESRREEDGMHYVPLMQYIMQTR